MRRGKCVVFMDKKVRNVGYDMKERLYCNV